MSKRKQHDSDPDAGIPIDPAATMDASREAAAAEQAPDAAPERVPQPDDQHAPVADPRPHMWHRPARVDEVPDGPKDSAYGHELPRWVHKGIGGPQKFVTTEAEFDDAANEGYEVHPTAPYVPEL